MKQGSDHIARNRLSRELIVDAAIEVADREGLGAMSMRRLAAAMEVEAMSLYNHVADKNDLQTAMVGRIWDSVDLALDEAAWRPALHRLCGSASRALRAHPWFFALSLPGNGGTARLAVIEATLTHLHTGGLAPDVSFHALHAIDGYVYGYSWQASEFAAPDVMPDADEIARMLESRPFLQAHAAQHFAMDSEASQPDGFAFGLDALLDGFASTGADR